MIKQPIDIQKVGDVNMTKISSMKIRSWMRMESEHTKSNARQKKIVNEHIEKYGAGYYPALKRMESKLKRK